MNTVIARLNNPEDLTQMSADMARAIEMAEAGDLESSELVELLKLMETARDGIAEWIETTRRDFAAILATV
jgi:hypothetical protein